MLILQYLLYLWEQKNGLLTGELVGTGEGPGPGDAEHVQPHLGHLGPHLGGEHREGRRHAHDLQGRRVEDLGAGGFHDAGRVAVLLVKHAVGTDAGFHDQAAVHPLPPGRLDLLRLLLHLLAERGELAERTVLVDADVARGRA